MKTTFEIEGLDSLEKTLGEMINKYPQEFEKLVIQVAYELQGMVKIKTPRKTGRLRDAWRVGKVKRKDGGLYVEVYNNVEYAEFVNYGHRTGKTGFKEGVYMLEISMEKLQERMPPFLKTWIENFIRENGL
ncbi:MAG: HK97 gp10 family phage protein [Bacillota bacterium]|nr:HK97 gp10 family phage protein [Bacillota bacterium]